MEIPPTFEMIMLCLLSIAVPAALWLGAMLRAERSKLAQQHAVLDRIENIARMGHWHFDPVRNTQHWSAQMCRIYGLDTIITPDQELRRELDRDGGDFLRQTLQEHAETRESFRIEYDIIRPDRAERLLRMDAMNTFDGQTNLRFVDAVVTDVTDEYQQTMKLAEEKSAALELALTDPLTGLANRRRMMAEIDRQIMICRQHFEERDRNLSLIVFDLDHFKTVNDTFGHQAGDKVLQRIAEITLEHVRDGDVVGRVGGDEFVWLLPDACAEIASNAAIRLRRAIAAGSGLDGIPPITASAGHATWIAGDTGLSLFAGADAALYGAKRAGRNQVRMAA